MHPDYSIHLVSGIRYGLEKWKTSDSVLDLNPEGSTCLWNHSWQKCRILPRVITTATTLTGLIHHGSVINSLVKLCMRIKRMCRISQYSPHRNACSNWNYKNPRQLLRVFWKCSFDTARTQFPIITRILTGSRRLSKKKEPATLRRPSHQLCRTQCHL